MFFINKGSKYFLNILVLVCLIVLVSYDKITSNFNMSLFNLIVKPIGNQFAIAFSISQKIKRALGINSHLLKHYNISYTRIKINHHS